MADTDIAVTSLMAEGGAGTIMLDWGYTDATSPLPYLKMDHFEVWAATANDRSGATKVTDTPDLNYTLPGLDYGDTFYFWVRGVDASGNLGDFYPLGATAGTAGTAKAKAGTGDIEDGAVTTDKLAFDAVTEAKIADAAISADKIMTDAVTAIKIAAGAVEAAKLAVAAVTSSAIDTGAVIAAKIATGAVTTIKIAADAVTATELAALAVDSAAIQTGAVLTAKIAALAVTTAELGNDAVTSAKILANTIVAGDIAAGTITANEIAAGTITAAKIAAGTITATEIAAATITGAKIAANTVAASNIVASSITARELVVADLSNIIPDPAFLSLATTYTDAAGVNFGSLAVAAAQNGFSQGRILTFPAGLINPSASYVGGVASKLIPVEAGKQYAFGATVGLAVTGTGQMVVEVGWFNGAGGAISADTIANHTTANVQTDYAVILTAPATAVHCWVRLIRYSTGTNVASVALAYVGNLYARKAVSASLIVDGTITAAKILAGTITATEIAAGTITASKIASGTITATQIASGTITGTQIAANTVAASNIVAGSITARELILTDFSNVVPDPDFLNFANTYTDAAGVNFGNISISTGVAGFRQGRLMFFVAGLINPAASYVAGGACKSFPVEGGKQYGFGVTAGIEAGGNGSVVVDYAWLNAAFGVVGSGTIANHTTAGAQTDYNVADIAPASAAYCQVRVIRYATGTNVAAVGYGYAGNLFVRKAVNASLIVDGSIVAGKISAGAINTSSLMVDGVVIDAKILQGAVTDGAQLTYSGSVASSNGAYQTISGTALTVPASSFPTPVGAWLDWTTNSSTATNRVYSIIVEFTYGGGTYIIGSVSVTIADGARTLQLLTCLTLPPLPSSGTLRLRQNSTTSNGGNHTVHNMNLAIGRPKK